MAYSMDRWVGKAAIVTGGSMGIGYSIVEHLLEAGVNVVAVARGKEKLAAASEKLKDKKGKIFTFSGDMSKEEDILSLFKWVKTNVGPVHILVNNAGVYPQTTLTTGDTASWKAILDLQVLGLCIATREAVQDMRANNVNGHIIHLNGIDGHKILNIPNLNVLSASKHAITALTETLRNEFNLFNDKIKISSISPGVVDTEGYRALFSEILEKKLINSFLDTPALKPKDIAQAVLFVLSTAPHVQVHELIIKPVGEQF